MSRRAWGSAAAAALICVAFAHFCVRIVPADAPPPPASPILSPTAPAALSSKLVIPVRGVPPSALADTFTQARAGGARPHGAIDIMAARGRPVVAATDGRVEKLFWSGEGGRTVYQRSPDGRRIYYYAHLGSYAPGLAEGQALRRGQPIGTVGVTGNADAAAPHLHFAIYRAEPGDPWYGGQPINPYPLLVGR